MHGCLCVSVCVCIIVIAEVSALCCGRCRILGMHTVPPMCRLSSKLAQIMISLKMCIVIVAVDKTYT